MAEIVSIKCPNCDGELKFDPKSQGYTCEWCGSFFDQSFFDQMEGAAAAAGGEAPPAASAQASAEEEAGRIFTCPSCGAEVVTDATTAATFCYYCHNPVVLSGRLSGNLLPDFIIPFKIPKEEASDKLIKSTNKKWFVPKNFFDSKQIENLTGVYFPYWKGEGHYVGLATAEGNRVRSWTTGDYQYTETKTFRVERGGTIDLKNWLAIALSKTNQVLAEGVQPYDFKELKPFSYGYLTGFQAERRDIEKKVIEERAGKEFRTCADSTLRSKMSGYTTITKFNSNYTKEDIDMKYTLLPVWTMTYQGKGDKVYFYSMNGQTGSVIGDFPISMPKLLLFASILSGIVLALFLLGGWLL